MREVSNNEQSEHCSTRKLLSLADGRSADHKSQTAALFVCLILLVLPTASAAQGVAQGATVFRGADIYTMTGSVVEGGVMVVRDGLIEAIGDATLPLPSGAELIDVSGKRIYPGIVQAYSNLGLSEFDSVAGSVDIGEVGENNADVRAEVAVSADGIRLLPAMAGGVLFAHVVPEGGNFTGSTALMRLEGWNWEDMTVAAPAALHLNFPNDDGASDDDAAQSQAMQALNRAFDEAAEYGTAKQAGLRLDTDRKLQRVLDVINGELRLLVHADSAAQMEAAIQWAEDRGLDDWILLGTTDAAYHAETLAEKGIPVLVETVLGVPSRDFEPYDHNFSAPARLAAAGVTFALTGQGDSAFARNLPFVAGMAVAHGLDPQVAIASITSTPAEILGVSDRIGSLEVGKEASFFIADGSPLEIVTTIEAVWMRGMKVDFERDQQRQLWKKYRDRPAP